MDHVKEYNASYNYFAGMTDEAVARYQKDAMVGHRPTWSMGGKSAAAQHTGGTDEFVLEDPLGIFRAVLTWLADGGAITLDNDLSDAYGPVYYGSLLGIPIPVWVFLAVSAAGAVLLNRTAFGRYVQAIGSNEQVARFAAVDVDRVKLLTYGLLGVCVGIATVLYVPRLGSASPTTGLLWELEAIAAVIVGGTSFKGGQGRIAGTVIGAILLSVISNILNLTSIISVYLNAAVQGCVIIAVAFLQRRRP